MKLVGKGHNIYDDVAGYCIRFPVTVETGPEIIAKRFNMLLIVQLNNISVMSKSITIDSAAFVIGILQESSPVPPPSVKNTHPLVGPYY